MKNKNTSYGSTKIRDKLNTNTLLSLGIATLLLSSIFGASYLFRKIYDAEKDDQTEEKLITHAELSEPPEIKQPEPQQPKPPEEQLEKSQPNEKPAPTPKKVPPKPEPEQEVEFTEPEIEENPDFVEDDVPTQEMLQEAGTQVAPPENTQESGAVTPSSTENTAGANTQENSDSEDQVFEVVETDPQFPGGEKALLQYLNNNIEYPRLARQEAIEGRVILQFVVGADGNISNIEVVKGLGRGLDEEAIRLVKNMPNWEPGRQRGRPVRVKYTLPVTFNLEI